MPKTIFTVYMPCSCDCEAQRVVKELIHKKIVSSAGTEERFILGRHYLTRQQLRDGYRRSKQEKENV